jgi:hypothetical protein
MFTKTRTVLALTVVALGAALVTTSTPADAAMHGAGSFRGGMSAPRMAPRGNMGFRPNFAFRHAGNSMARSWPPKGTNWPTKTGCYGGGCGKPHWPGSSSKPHWPGKWPQAGHYPYRPHWPHHRPWYPTYTPSYAPSYVSAPAYVAPTYVAPTPVTYAAPAPAYAPAPVAAAPCTCLKKEYTQDGQVVMRDVCTNEVLAGPVQQQQAQYPQQQQPQQQ